MAAAAAAAAVIATNTNVSLSHDVSSQNYVHKVP